MSAQTVFDCALLFPLEVQSFTQIKVNIHGQVIQSYVLGDTCTMADYSRLKSILLDLQAHHHSQLSSPVEDRTSQKRLLVEDMFKYLDINSDGHLSSSELAQVGLSLNENWIMKWIAFFIQSVN